MIQLLLDLLADKHLEVREMAATTLSGIVRCSQRSLVHRVAKQVLWYNRSHALTYKLVEWVYRHDEGEEGRALVAELLDQRLSELDLESEGMMDLDEVDELMDCQIVVDSCKAQLQQMKQEIQEQMEVDEQPEGMAN